MVSMIKIDLRGGFLMHPEIQQIIEALKVIDSYNELAIAIQDMDFIHLYHTNNYAKLIDLKPNLVGVRFKNLSKDKEFQQTAKILNVISEYVNHTGIKVRSVFTYKTPIDQERKSLLVEESIIFSKTTGEKLGRYVRIEPFDFRLVAQVLSLNNVNVPLQSEDLISMEEILINEKKPSAPISLTVRESEVLTLVLLGMGHKEIASVLSNAHGKSIRDTSVRDVIHDQLFKKFNVINLQDLKRQVLKNIPMRCIPESLLLNDISVINSVELPRNKQ